MTRRLIPRPGFRGQLFLVITAGVVGVSLITALVNAWSTTKRLRAIHLEQGLQITRALARQSVLALVYGSGDNAEEAVNATLAFPGIQYVALLDEAGELLLAQGETPATVELSGDASLPDDAPHMVAESPNHWDFMAPVLLNPRSQEETAGEETLFLSDAGSRELLGHVYVVMGKGAMQEIQRGIIGANLLTAAIVTGLCLLLLHLLVGRLIRPLDALSTVMSQAGHQPPEPSSVLEGPVEVVRIARVYNRMIEAIAERDGRLRQHNERLESEVDLRTRELVVARDMALESSRHKSEFLANMTHELRTPLQSVIGYADFALEIIQEEGPQECVDDLEKVVSNAQRLLGLINEVLDYSKTEAGRMPVHLEMVDPRELARQALEAVVPSLTENRNQWRLDLDDEAPPVALDASKIRMILINLLGNAAKFTHNGQIDLALRQDQRGLMFSVRDTGIGMTPEQQSAIFDPFMQVDGSRTRLFQGTGLGLAVTRKFCQLLGGEVSVESVLGVGSLFTVHIPLPIRPQGSVEAESHSGSVGEEREPDLTKAGEIS